MQTAYDCVIPPMEKAVVKTDIQIALPSGCYGRVAGVIDEDYRGNVGVVLFNFGKETFEVKKGDRIAQLICERIYYPELEEVECGEGREQFQDAIFVTEIRDVDGEHCCFLNVPAGETDWRLQLLLILHKNKGCQLAVRERFTRACVCFLPRRQVNHSKECELPSAKLRGVGRLLGCAREDVTIRTFTAERPICVDTLPKFTVIRIKALIHILTRNTNNTNTEEDTSFLMSPTHSPDEPHHLPKYHSGVIGKSQTERQQLTCASETIPSVTFFTQTAEFLDGIGKQLANIHMPHQASSYEARSATSAEKGIALTLVDVCGEKGSGSSQEWEYNVHYGRDVGMFGNNSSEEGRDNPGNMPILSLAGRRELALSLLPADQKLCSYGLRQLIATAPVAQRGEAESRAHICQEKEIELITVPDFLNKYPAKLSKDLITLTTLPQPLMKSAGAHQADER
ncbi:hypothetical protein IHE44_0002754 [Lamprotornis superbus]|uniref:dUTP diphosphatase n=1 Tax=Lamprotornis superbus TaxID=245042 RepID=A0A835U0U7_9PASS|nr:hypothetical protein IHE44_0002754 [Lamprotornis superbus]